MSLSGSAITVLALPLTAVLFLSASPTELGMLLAAQQLPVFMFSLFAGVLVDLLSRKRTIVAADCGLAVLTGSIPVLAYVDRLSLPYLALCGFCLGTLSLISRLAKTAYLPSLVPEDALVRSNARLQVSQSIAGVIGPSAAGVIVRLLSAPAALVLDALSFLVSAMLVSAIRSRETDVPEAGNQGVILRIVEAMRFVVHSPVLRLLLCASMLATLGAFMQQAVLLIYLSDTLGLSPASIGLVYSALGGGAVAGAALASVAAGSAGIRAALIAGMGAPAVGMLLIPMAALVGNPVPGLIAAQCIIGFGASLYYVNEAALRQSCTPPAMLGRTTAIRSFFAGGVSPLGALLGGGIGEVFALEAALYAGALCMAIAAIVLLCQRRNLKMP